MTFIEEMRGETEMVAILDKPSIVESKDYNEDLLVKSEDETNEESFLSSEEEDPIEIYDNFLKDIHEEKKQLLKENDFLSSVKNLDLINKMAEMEESFRAKKNFPSANKAKRVKEQLSSIMTLRPLRQSRLAPIALKKGQNAKEISNKKKEKFQRVFKKLESNKKYTFLPPNELRPILESRLPSGRKHYAEGFMEVLTNFIDIVSLKDQALFITQTFNRIYFLKKDDYDHEFLQLIVTIMEETFGYKSKEKPMEVDESKLPDLTI